MDESTSVGPVVPEGKQGEVLVAILNNQDDFAIARDSHWYRIPISSVVKWLKDRWPPEWIAFYQTKVFGPEAFAINYYARVLGVRRATRRELFPDEPTGDKRNRRYYQLQLSRLERLPQPILSRRWRRIVFIPTTWNKLIQAEEINDLHDGSPLEDRLWAEFRRLEIAAERQEVVNLNSRFYFLDFAVYCVADKLDVETDGDAWHANPERAAEDNRRDNDLETDGWRILRFNGQQIREEMATYSLPIISENINRLGGLSTDRNIPRNVYLETPTQLSLFDPPSTDEDEKSHGSSQPTDC